MIASILLLSLGTSPRGRALESIFEDDQLLVDQPLNADGNAQVATTLATLKTLGVDRVRVLVEWNSVAPAATSSTEPAGFDAGDPSAYGTAWARYDRLDQLAAAEGLAVYFDLTTPAPAWAATVQPDGTDTAARADADVYGPSAADFEQFVEAAGARYSGHYKAADDDGHALPRVSFWSALNEPNQPGWLSPQESPRDGENLAPALYRALVDGFWDGMVKSGHSTSTDTLLIGELAPNGCQPTGACAFAGLGADYRPIPPLTFLDDLYCVGPGGADASDTTGASRDLRQLRGRAATAVGCPAGGGTASFIAENPGLFESSGLAEHPYSFSLAPDVGYSLAADASFAPLAGLGGLESAIDGAFAVYGQPHDLALYLTEYGYVTNPPNPHYAITPAQQALYLDEATYIAAQNPRVEALAQFELQDSDPAAECGCAPRSPRYWDNFEEGLEYLGGKPKPAYAAYRLPIFLPGLEAPTRRAAPDTPVQVWGMLRPAVNDSTQTAQIQWRAAGGGAWRTLAHTTTRDPSGILSREVVLPASGEVRLTWRSAAGVTLHSRSVAVSVA